MVKYLDYLISAVRYNFEHTQIVDVKRHLDQGENVARDNIVSRNIILDDLRKGVKYRTIHRSPEGKWKIGKNIQISPDREVITTNPNSTTKDNLENIPEF